MQLLLAAHVGDVETPKTKITLPGRRTKHSFVISRSSLFRRMSRFYDFVCIQKKIERGLNLLMGMFRSLCSDAFAFLCDCIELGECTECGFAIDIMRMVEN